MPDQMPPPSQPYGPFTDVLTGPLSGQRQQALQQPSGWGGSGAALANYANAFIKSAQVGQREKLERSEMEKAAHERNFDSVHSYIQNSDTISQEGKQAAEKAYLMGKFSQVADHASQGEKQNKDNPLFALTKAITGAVMGPGELKNHKDMAVDVNALLNIANDERFRIDPRKMAADAGAGVADVLRGAAAGTPAVAGETFQVRYGARPGEQTQGPTQATMSSQQAPASAATVPVAPGGVMSPMVNRFPELAAGESAMVQDLVNRPKPRVVTMPDGVGVPGNVYGPNGEYFRDPKTGLFYDKSGVATGVQDTVYRPKPGDENIRPELMGGGPAQANAQGGGPQVAPAMLLPPSAGRTMPVTVGGEPAVPGKQLTQDEALQNPQIKERLLALQRAGISWDKDPYLSRLIGGLPKSAAPKMLPGTGNAAINPDTGRTEVYHRYQDADGRTYNVFDGVALAAKPTANTGNLRNMWVKTPDGKVVVAFINPRKPDGFVDEHNRPLPDGTVGAVSPTDGAGQRGIYRNIARTIITNRGEEASEAAIDALAGQMLMQQQGSILEQRQQEIGIGAAETGIGGGGGFNTATPKPAAQQQGAPRQVAGLVEQGNINLNNRPVVKNADGSISTVRSKSFNFEGKEVLLPTVSDDGKILTDDQAMAQYRQTGKHLGKFDSPENATAYAQSLHQQQAKQYVQPRTAPPPGAENQPGRLGAFKNQADYDDASLYYRSVMGAGAAPGKMSIRTERGANRLGEASGLNPAELVSAINENKADNEVLKTTVKNAAGFATLERRISNHAALLEKAINANKSVIGVPVADMTYQFLLSHLGEHEDVKKLEVAVNAVQREYGSLLGNSPTSSRSVPVSFQNEANKLISTTTPIKTMLAAIQQIRKESGATQEAFKRMLTEQRDKVNQDPISRAFGQVAAAAAEAGPGRGGQQQDAGGVVSFIVKTPKDGEHTVTVKASDAEAKKKQILATPGYSIRQP